jgi:hypothetical protein
MPKGWQRRSRPVGWTATGRSLFDRPLPARVYEALIDHPCSWCGATIRAGDLLTKRRRAGDAGGRGAAGPVCRACAPFSDPR